MRIIRFLGPLPIVLALGSCVDPRAQASTAQAVMDMSNAVTGMQQDVQDLTGTVDSLRAVVAHQDTLIERLATLAHVPWPPPRD